VQEVLSDFLLLDIRAMEVLSLGVEELGRTILLVSVAAGTVKALKLVEAV
jgi:hypothetical protein